MSGAETILWHQQRRNSVVQLRRDAAGSLRIVKRYHATYSAADERAAYDRIEVALRDVPGTRVPRRLSAGPDELALEYVEAPTLAALLVHGRMPPVEPGRLGPLLVALRGCDTDPGNLLLDGNTIVVIDPLLRASTLPNLSAAVFLHGVIKAAAASLPRVWRWPALMRFARAVLREYSSSAGTQPSAVLHDLAIYQHQVMAWNRDSDRSEGMLRLLIRRYAFVPILGVIRQVVLLQERRS